MEDILKAYTIDFRNSWEGHLPLVEFAYNNNYHSSIGIVPFEAFYSRPYWSSLYWAKVGDNKLLGPELVRETN